MEALILAAALLGTGAEPIPQFTVVNRTQPTFTVENRCQPAPANPSAAVPVQTYTLPSATYGGCADGNCAVPQSRPVLFPRLRGR